MAVSELPGNPNAVWTVKMREDGKLNSITVIYQYAVHSKFYFYIIIYRSKSKNFILDLILRVLCFIIF